MVCIAVSQDLPQRILEPAFAATYLVSCDQVGLLSSSIKLGYSSHANLWLFGTDLETRTRKEQVYDVHFQSLPTLSIQSFSAGTDFDCDTRSPRWTAPRHRRRAHRCRQFNEESFIIYLKHTRLATRFTYINTYSLCHLVAQFTIIVLMSLSLPIANEFRHVSRIYSFLPIQTSLLARKTQLNCREWSITKFSKCNHNRNFSYLHTLAIVIILDNLLLT
jgi:hypothetical protein